MAQVVETLDWLEDRLSANRYLAGAGVTGADWRLPPTLLRFDPVCHGHFKCDQRRLVDDPALWGYARDLSPSPGVAGTFRRDHAVRPSHDSHAGLDPQRIVAVWPELDLMAPHGRDRPRAA